MRAIAVSIDEKTLERVDALVASSHHLRNRSAVVRAAVRAFAEDELRRQSEEHERTVLHKNRQRLARQARALIGAQART
jgi:metal-responsive CopG/Arc/MetJ family transcriptional regulator